MSSPNARTRALYREQGYLCDIVEHYNAATRRKHDLFGIFDLLAVGFGADVIGVQATETGHMQNRVQKILANPVYEQWLARGGRVHVVGWALRGRAADGPKTYVHKVIEMTRESHPPCADLMAKLYVPEEHDH